MNVIFAKLLGIFGWQKLVLMAWNTAYPSMLKAAQKTDSHFDDDVLKFVNDMLVALTGAPVEVEKPKELKA